jgi:hypothetical protein
MPELAISREPAELFVAVSGAPVLLDPASSRPLLTDDGRTWAVLGQCNGVPALSFPGVADCVVDLAARRITCHRHPSGVGASLRHALLDHVIPRVLAALGSTVLHASAVMAEGTAWLFAGPSGSGKSTVAARFLEAGYPLISDDAVALDIAGDRWRASVSYPGLRLWQDAIDRLAHPVQGTPMSVGATKSRVDARGRTLAATEAGAEVGLVALIKRRPGTTVVRRRHGALAFSGVWENLFGWPGAGLAVGALDQVTRLVEDVPVLEVEYVDGTSVADIADALRPHQRTP